MRIIFLLFFTLLYAVGVRGFHLQEKDAAAAAAVVVVENVQPVVVALYYETLCPECQHFITHQMWPTFQALGKSGIMKLVLYPYGNAHYTANANGSYTFTCQHGPKECQGNIYEACIIVK